MTQAMREEKGKCSFQRAAIIRRGITATNTTCTTIEAVNQESMRAFGHGGSERLAALYMEHTSLLPSGSRPEHMGAKRDPLP
ncbi:MAG TPA: hypothetical protein VH593_22240 [Ktedonobacteraceae bacterium]